MVVLEIKTSPSAPCWAKLPGSLQAHHLCISKSWTQADLEGSLGGGKEQNTLLIQREPQNQSHNEQSSKHLENLLLLAFASMSAALPGAAMATSERGSVFGILLQDLPNEIRAEDICGQLAV